MSSNPSAPPRPPLSGPGTGPAPRRGAPLPRAWGIAIVVGLAALLVAIWVSNSGAIEGTLRSPQALALTVGAIAGFVVVHWLLRRVGLGPAPRLAVLAVPAVVIFWLYLLPSFEGGRVVDEALPGADPAALADATATEPTPVAEAAATEGASTQGASTQGTAAPEAASTEAAPQGEPAAEAPAEPAPAEPSAPPAGPVQLTSGTFVGLDGHDAAGVAAVYRLDDGSHIVRFEDVDIQNTPAPVVYLVPGADATDPGADFVDLGPLKGEIGSANYPIPDGVDLDAQWTVLVWCSTFASPIGGATQA
jgi:hypothetical protein